MWTGLAWFNYAIEKAFSCLSPHRQQKSFGVHSSPLDTFIFSSLTFTRCCVQQEPYSYTQAHQPGGWSPSFITQFESFRNINTIPCCCEIPILLLLGSSRTLKNGLIVWFGFIFIGHVYMFLCNIDHSRKTISFYLQGSWDCHCIIPFGAQNVHFLSNVIHRKRIIMVYFTDCQKENVSLKSFISLKLLIFYRKTELLSNMPMTKTD